MKWIFTIVQLGPKHSWQVGHCIASSWGSVLQISISFELSSTNSTNYWHLRVDCWAMYCRLIFFPASVHSQTFHIPKPLITKLTLHSTCIGFDLSIVHFWQVLSHCLWKLLLHTWHTKFYAGWLEISTLWLQTHFHFSLSWYQHPSFIPTDFKLLFIRSLYRLLGP